MDRTLREYLPEPIRRRLRRLARRRRWRQAASRYPARQLSARGWIAVWAFVGTAVLVAAGLTGDRSPVRPSRPAAEVLAQLAVIPVLASRPPHRADYERTAFGVAWTDETDVAESGNGCDTRNDVLRRDLTEVRTGPTSGCARAVVSGDLRSPYTGGFVSFRRGRNSAAVQIDHIVPLSYAWDMGASGWSASRRADFANDPANLVAVDGPSNMDKGDQEPARWMPPADQFHCQYATQFVTVVRAYGLYLDAPSARLLARVLRRC